MSWWHAVVFRVVKNKPRLHNLCFTNFLSLLSQNITFKKLKHQQHFIYSCMKIHCMLYISIHPLCFKNTPSTYPHNNKHSCSNIYAHSPHGIISPYRVPWYHNHFFCNINSLALCLIYVFTSTLSILMVKVKVKLFLCTPWMHREEMGYSSTPSLSNPKQVTGPKPKTQLDILGFNMSCHISFTFFICEILYVEEC